MSSPRLPRTPVSPPPAHGCRAPARRGFAIIISITLLAFLVLLLLSLVLLTRVGTQISANGLQDAQARQNALMAVQVALGQLQKFAGPDQRITAPAEFGDFSSAANGGIPISPFTPVASTGVVSPQTGTRYWTGVWGNSDPGGAIFLRSPKPRLLTWLVSGNEAVTVPSTTKYGQIISGAPAVTYTPSMSVSGLTASSSALTALSIGSVPAVLLVGGNSATSSTTLPKAEDNYVAAPLVNISISAQMLPGFSGTQTKLSGRFAFAVLDEGVKAKVNLRDPYDGSNTLSGTTATNIDARVRVQSAQRTGIELVTGFADNASSGTYVSGMTIGYPVNSANAATNAQFDSILSLTQARFLDATATTTTADADIRENFHNLTAYSFGVLADSQRGGLRKDLTALLEDNTLFTSKAVLPLAGKNILPDSGEIAHNLLEPSMADSALNSITTGTFTPGNVSPKNNGPQWDLIKSFYSIANTLTTSSASKIIARAGSPTVMPITPVIDQARIFWTFALNPSNEIIIQTHLAIMLGNPYAATLTTTAAGLSIYYTSPGWGWQIGGESPVYFKGPFTVGGITTNGRSAGYPIINLGYYGFPRPVGQYPNFTSAAQLSTFMAFSRQPALDTDPTEYSAMGPVTFNIPQFSIAPGQLKTFVISGAGTYNNSRAGATTPYVVKMVDLSTQPATAILTSYFAHDTNQVVSPGSSFSLQTDDWSTMAIYLVDPSTAHTNGNLTYPGNVLQSLINNDLPGDTNGTYALTFSATSTISTVGFTYMLSLPGLQHGMGSNGDTAGEDQRIFGDYNLVASYKPVPLTNTPWGGFSNIPTMDTYFSNDFNGQFAENANPAAWGRNFNGTSLDTVLFDLPRRSVATPTSSSEMPMLSVGFLQHANLTADDYYPFVGHQPGNAVGNSWFSLFVTRTATVQSRQDFTYCPDGSSVGLANCYDISYLLNCALWDKYYFSAIPQLTPGPGVSANPRLKYAAGFTPTATQLGLGTPGAAGSDPTGLPLPKESAPARYQMLDGAFNVNSTSIEAWKAVLASLRKRSVTMNDASGATTASSSFPRSLYQTQTYSQADTGISAAAFAGFRKLTDKQITTLATDLVQEIRLRGPFLSLAHFINRDGITTTTSTISPLWQSTQNNTVQVAGPLQTAIERSGINTANLGSDSSGALNIQNVTTLSIPLNSNSQGNAPAAANTSPIADSMPTITTSNTVPGACVTLNKSTGIPGWLTQADILEVLGPVLAARSDTFVIRAYGDSLDPINTIPSNIVPANILSRAWCEAVVQRFPDYIDPNNPASVDPNGATATTTVSNTTITALNQRFGRKFRVVAFRWLTPNDI